MINMNNLENLIAFCKEHKEITLDEYYNNVIRFGTVIKPEDENCFNYLTCAHVVSRE